MADTWVTRTPMQQYAHPITETLDPIKRIILLPDGDKFVTISRQRKVLLNSMVQKVSLKRFESYEQLVVDIAFLGRNRAMAICLDGSMGLWRISDGRCMATVEFRKRIRERVGEDLRRYRTTVMEHRLVPQAQTNRRGREDMWNEGGDEVAGRTEKVTKEFMEGCTLTSYGRHVMVSFPGMHEAQVWDTSTMNLVFRVPAQWGNTTCAGFDDQFAVLGSDLRQIHVYWRRTGELYHRVNSHVGPVTGLAIWRDGMVSTSEDGSIKVHSLGLKRVVWSVQCSGPVFSVAILGDKRIAVGTESGVVEILTTPQWVSRLFQAVGLARRRV